MPFSEAKIEAIMKAAEPIMYRIDRDAGETTESLVERIVIQSRFAVETNAPLGKEYIEIAKQVVEIADDPGWEPQQNVFMPSADAPEIVATDEIKEQAASSDALRSIFAATTEPEMERHVIEGFMFAHPVHSPDGTPGPLVMEIIVDPQEANDMIEHGVGGAEAPWLVEEICKAVAGNEFEPGYMGRMRITVEWEPWEDASDG